MKILAKANIAGVFKSGMKRYFINEQIDEDFTELNFSIEKTNTTQSKNISQLSRVAKNHFNNIDYLSAYQVTLEIILLCKKQKNYTQLLIAIFNANTLIYKLKYSRGYYGNKEYENLKVIDLQEQFLQLPKSDIRKQQTLFDFLTLKSIYIQATLNSNALIKINNSIESIKNGGFSYNNQANKPSVEHANLLLFTVKNHLIINESVFNQMMRHFIDISIARQSIKGVITLNTYELYTCIQHLGKKELTSLFSIFDKNDVEPPKLELSNINKKWVLNDVLTNIMEQCLNASSIYQFPETKLLNTITIISYIKLDNKEADKVLEEFSRLLSSKNNTVNTYESVNKFFATQQALFSTNMATTLLIELIEIIINKVVYRSAHDRDISAITDNEANNICNYIEVNSGVYSNIKLIEKLITELKGYDIERKVQFSKTLLYSVFKVGNDEIKTAIKTFINTVISEYKVDTDTAYIFILWCIAVDLLDEIETNMIGNLEAYISRLEDGNFFNIHLSQLKSLIDHLIKEKKITSLQNCQDLLQKIISNYDSSSNLSALSTL